MTPVIVVKLGGSLVGTPQWGHWLHDIAKALPGRGVVVPGGGPWADVVRGAQVREGFGDADAHRLALRAMEAHAREICSGRPTYAAAASADCISRVLSEGKVAVWLPPDMVLADASIPKSWDVTSDSLAAWLAHELDAACLMLLKSIPSIDPALDIPELARRGWVDPCFERFCANGAFRVQALGRDERAAFLQCASSLAGKARASGSRKPMS